MATLGPIFGGTAANITGVGTVSWSNTSNALTSNNSYAFADLGGDNILGPNNKITNYLRITNFDFSSLPDGATIDGITVHIEGWGEELIGFGAGNAVSFTRIRLVKAGTIQSTDKAGSNTLTDTDSTYNFGGASDTWSDTWSASDLKTSTFGVAMSFTYTGNEFGYIAPNVDATSITVNYTESSSSSTSTSSSSTSFSSSSSSSTSANRETECDLLDIQPNWANSQQLHPKDLIELIDLGYRLPSIDANRNAKPLMTFTQNFTLNTSQIDEFYQFYVSKFGSNKSFCLPSYSNEIILAADYTANSTTMTIENNGVTLNNNDNIYLNIIDTAFTDTVFSFNSTTSITLDNGFNIDLASGTPICKIYRVIFTNDTLDIEYINRDVATVSITCVEVR